MILDRAGFLVVFDFDGTLADGRACVLHAMRQAFSEQGETEPPADAILAKVGLRPVDAVPRLLPGSTAATAQAIAERYRQLVTSLSRCQPELERPFEGATRCLEGLVGDGITLAIATGKTREDLERSLSPYGWRRHFASLHSSDDGPGKPDPGLLRAALADADLDPGRAAMVGDTAYDIEMARRAGVRAIGVTWGFHERSRLEAARPERLVESFDLLCDCISGLVAGSN